MRLVSRLLRHPTCPLCRESVFLLETSTCEGCRTDYHQACLAEFTGCSTLGCASTTYVETDFSPPPPRPQSLDGIRVTPRASAPSMAWIRWLRFWSAAKGSAHTLREGVSVETIGLVGLVVGIGLLMLVLLSLGVQELLSMSGGQALGVLGSGLLLAIPVGLAHAISKRSER